VTDGEENGAEGEEGEVIGELIGACPDVMKSKDVVIDHAFDDVEEAPTFERESEELPPGPGEVVVAGSAPQEDGRGNEGEDRGQVEQSVGKRVEFEAANGRHWTAGFARQHVVPLKDLVENHAIEQSSEANPEEHSRRRDREASVSARGRRCSS
jgi:hypothetical protein